MKENTLKIFDRTLDDIVTLGAIGSLTYIAYLGVGDATLLVGAISGLGGYAVYRKNGKSTSE